LYYESSKIISSCLPDFEPCGNESWFGAKQNSTSEQKEKASK
jgi:hypothetical protein